METKLISQGPQPIRIIQSLHLYINYYHVEDCLPLNRFSSNFPGQNHPMTFWEMHQEIKDCTFSSVQVRVSSVNIKSGTNALILDITNICRSRHLIYQNPKTSNLKDVQY